MKTVLGEQRNVVEAEEDSGPTRKRDLEGR